MSQQTKPTGPGSVYQRKDGYWVAAVSLAGRRISRYTKTRQDARQLLQALVREHHLGQLVGPSRLTLADWVGQWLDMRGSDLRPSTRRAYRQALDPIAKEIGHLRLDRLTPAIMATCFADLHRKGLGARRLQLSYGYLRQCLRSAVDLEMLGSSPMTKTQRPKWEPRERRYWTVEETQKFLAVALNSRSKWAPLFTILTTCGLRISEALGLTWSDVDIRKRTMRVERAIVWVESDPILGPVKTKAAKRTIGLPEPAVIAFEKLPRPIDSDQLIFHTTTGKPPRPDHLRVPLASLCRKAKVPMINIHGLRHTAAALAFRATGDPYAVQRRLGHANVQVTIGIYGYGTRDDSEVAQSLGRLLSGESTE